MQKNLFIFFLLPFLSINCISVKSQIKNKIQQGIDGYVYLQSGNRMPSPEISLHPQTGISTTIFVYEITNQKDAVRINNSPFYSQINKKIIATVQSDTTGFFSLQLPVGNYSLFLKVNNQFYANLFDVNNNIQPVQVEQNKISHCIIYQNASAVY
jgi:hypothetical protein